MPRTTKQRSAPKVTPVTLKVETLRGASFSGAGRVATPAAAAPSASAA